MNDILSSFLSRIVIFPPVHQENLSIFPVILEKGLEEKNGNENILYLQSETVGKKKVYFRDLSKLTLRWWEKLIVSNYYSSIVFLPEGILLKGGRQNRILGRTYLLPRKRFFSRSFELQTYCIERLRSKGKRLDDFVYSGFAPAHIRSLGGDNSPNRPEKQKKVWESVSKSLILTGIQLGEVHSGARQKRKANPAQPDQTGFISLQDLQNTLLAMQSQEENSLSSLQLENPNPSPRISRTEDLTALYQDEMNTLIISQRIVHFQCQPNQVGVMGIIRGPQKVHSFLDLFLTPKAFEIYFKDLLSSYIITSHILGAEGGDRIKDHAPNGLEIAENLLGGLKSPYFESSLKGLLGENFRIIDKDIEASGHIWNDKIYYLRASNYQTRFFELFLEEGVTFVGRKLPREMAQFGIYYYELDDPLISRKHGRFIVEGSSIFYEDLGSTNGSEILGSKGFTAIEKKTRIQEGSLLRLGDTYLKVYLKHIKENTLFLTKNKNYEDKEDIDMNEDKGIAKDLKQEHEKEHRVSDDKQPVKKQES
ncbi:MAG: FHA domain-containing protein [Planctomycetota bacterium]|nr:MAG: FHA domain-containing protein [Planctomycetota bacterium]